MDTPESSSQSEQTDAELMDSMLGRMLTHWSIGDGGLHFTLDDGRTVIFAGHFVIAIMDSEEPCLH